MSTPETRARDSILTKLRNAAADTDSLFANHADPAQAYTVPTAVTSADQRGPELAATFGENLSLVLGSYEIVDDVNEVADRIVARIAGWREENEGTGSYGGEILGWAPSALPIADLSEQLEQRCMRLFVPTDMCNDDDRRHAATLSVGLTGVDAAFAGTGSMVLAPGSGKNRVASLLPLHHVALVPISKIYPTLESWLASLRKEGTIEALFRDHAQLTFITGPSKSADIELNLTLGVHGPRDVHAIVFDDSW